jgi:phage/conjugal plasmid C-4 type zinc finger TraR family protein
MDEIDQIQELEQQVLELRLKGIRSQTKAALMPGEEALGEEECEECGTTIPLERRRAMPTCTRCIDCQSRIERRK